MKRHLPALATLIAGALLSGAAFATVVGANVPTYGVTTEAIATLPASEQTLWQTYLDRSVAQMRADKAALAAEGPPAQDLPPMKMRGDAEKTMPLDRDAVWYATPEARHIADVIVSFQTPAGGWSKNQSRDGALRQPGQPYTGDNDSRYPTPGDFDTPREAHWHYVGTLDNDATITELRFLARVVTQNPGSEADAYRTSFLRGTQYLFNAQHPNGGWPQVWPLEGGYHDAITFNDNALEHAAELMSKIASGTGDYAFVPQAVRAQAAASQKRALACILATQVIVDGKRTIWGQQHDALTLKPVSARNYEPDALASEESADLLLYLMRLPNPSPAVVMAVHDGVAWLDAVALHDVAWARSEDKALGRRLVASRGAGPLWSRYYAPATGKPIFGDRDKSLHGDVNDLSLERRNGYSWFNTSPEKALKTYATWSQMHPK